jgi:prophage regulatory protein
MQAISSSSAVPKRGAGRNPQSLQTLQLDEALLSIATVSQAVGLSASTIYRRVASGDFPEPVRLGQRCTRFKASAVRAWIRAQGGEQ